MLLERLKQETHAVERKNAKVSERNIEGRIFFSMNKKGKLTQPNARVSGGKY